MGRWWRAYEDALHDPKVQGLPDRLFKRWFNILCVASKYGGTLPSTPVLTYLLTGRSDHVERDVKALLNRGLLDEIDGQLAPHNWFKFQYKTDNSTERVRAHRTDKRNVSVTANETAPEYRVQSTESERKIPSLRSGRARGTRLSIDWLPSDDDLAFADRFLERYQIEDEQAKFRDYWLALAGPKAVKLDWPATWRNWIRKAKNDQGLQTNSNGNRRPLSEWQIRQRRKDDALAALSASIERGERQAASGSEGDQGVILLVPDA